MNAMLSISSEPFEVLMDNIFRKSLYLSQKHDIRLPQAAIDNNVYTPDELGEYKHWHLPQSRQHIVH